MFVMERKCCQNYGRNKLFFPPYGERTKLLKATKTQLICNPWYKQNKKLKSQKKKFGPHHSSNKRGSLYQWQEYRYPF